MREISCCYHNVLFLFILTNNSINNENIPINGLHCQITYTDMSINNDNSLLLVEEENW